MRESSFRETHPALTPDQYRTSVEIGDLSLRAPLPGLGWRFAGVAHPDSGRCATVPGGNSLMRYHIPPIYQSPEHSRAGTPAPRVRI
jgi:hypothetical protein